MSWQRLWLRMMGRDLRRTTAYVLPTALAVTFFLLFRSLLENMGSAMGIEASPFGPERLIDAAFSFTSYLVAFFSAFFAIYFHRLYVQGESQALGLLATFGLSPRDRRNLIRLESVALGAVSFALGVAFAYLLGPLFARFTAVFFDLGADFAFRVPAKALGETGVFFGVVFLVEALYTSFWTVRRWPRELFSAALQAEAIPKPSVKFGALGFLSLLGGYGLAVYVHPCIVSAATYASDPQKMTYVWLPLTLAIVVLVLGGSYFVLRDTLRLWVLWRRRRFTEGKGGDSPAGLFLLGRLGADLRRFSGVITVFAGVFAAFFTLVAAILFMTESEQLRAIEHYPVPLQASFALEQEIPHMWEESAPESSGAPGSTEPPAPAETSSREQGVSDVQDFFDLLEARKVFAERIAWVASRLAENGIKVDQKVPFEVARFSVVLEQPLPSDNVPQDQKEATLRIIQEYFRTVEVLPQSVYEKLRAARVAHASPSLVSVESLPPLPPLTGNQAFFLAQGMDASTFSRFVRESGKEGFPFASGSYEMTPGWGSLSAPEPSPNAERKSGSVDREVSQETKETISFELVGATGIRSQVLSPKFSAFLFPDATLVVADELWDRLPHEDLFARGELAFGEAMWVAESSLSRLHRLAGEYGLSGLGGSQGINSHGGTTVEPLPPNVRFSLESQSTAVKDAILERLSYLYAFTFLGILLFAFGALALYLRLREGEARDLAEVQTLRSLGFRTAEVRQIWRREALALYLLPLVFAMLHLAFAVVDAGGVLPRASGVFQSFLVALEGVRPPTLVESIQLIPPPVVRDLFWLVAGNLLLFAFYAFFAGSTYGQELWRRAAQRRW